MTATPIRTRRAMATGSLALVLVTFGCAAEPAAHPGSDPEIPPTGAATMDVDDDSAVSDGSHTGRLISLTTTETTVALVRVLSGDDAIAAAEADGGRALDEDGTLPNDVYTQDLDRVVTIPVAGDGSFMIYDCTTDCELVVTTLSALAEGRVVPFGGPNAVFDLWIERGAVVAFEERYLP